MMSEKEIVERLDTIIALLEKAGKPPSILLRITNGVATGAGILGILPAVDILKSWLGG